MTPEFTRQILEASDGVRSLDYTTTDYEPLLLPTLASMPFSIFLRHTIQLFSQRSNTSETISALLPTTHPNYPRSGLPPLPLGNRSPQRHQRRPTPNYTGLGGSIESLTTLELYDTGEESEATDAVLAVFSRIPFPLLRHLVIKSVGANFVTLLPLLALIPSLESLNFVDALSLGGVFKALGRASPSTLSVLRVRGDFFGPTAHLSLSDLMCSLGLPGLRRLRRLHLPRAFRDTLSDAEAQELEEACEARDIEIFFEY